MQLLEDHPGIALRDCRHCQDFQYDEGTGEVETWRGKPLVRIGRPPCRTPGGCPKGTPENSKALNDENWQAYQHHLECQIVNRLTDDPIVTRNACAIARARQILDHDREQKQAQVARLRDRRRR